MEEAAAVRLSQELADVRRRGISLNAQRAELSERIKAMEARTLLPEFQQQLQSEIKQSKIELEGFAAAEQERGLRESELTGQFQAVQNQLAESRARISGMERSLDAAIQQLLKQH